MSGKWIAGLSIGVSCALSATALLAQEVTLRGVSAFPKGMSLTDDFMRYIDTVNTAGKGVVQIRFVGGPEVTPTPEQGAALSKGVFDLLFGAPTFYAGIFPEADAFAGDLLPTAQLRANGADKIFDQALAKRVNAKLLAFAGGDVGLFVFTKDQPRLKDGLPDFSGVKLRGAPLYNDFFRQMGATSVVIQGSEVYTALERGLVSGIGWNLMGLTESGWNKFLNYRIEPAMYKSSLVVTMNLDKWKGLSDQARTLIAKVGVEYEKALVAYYVDRQKQELQKLDGAGMKPFALEPKAASAYQKAAFDTAWARVEKAKGLEIDLAATRKAFYGR